MLSSDGFVYVMTFKNKKKIKKRDEVRKDWVKNSDLNNTKKTQFQEAI